MSKFIRYLTLIVGAVIVLLPPYIILVTAFKSNEEFAKSLPYALPKTFFNPDNFRIVFEKGHLGLAFANIAYIIALAVAGNVVLGTMAAYALGRFHFKLKNIILGAYSLSLIIPGVTTQVATFSIIKHLGLTDTVYSMVLLGLGTDVIQIYIYLQLIQNIPYELDESAIVEGASLFKIYRSIIFPLLTPATVTVVILKIINLYNDVYTPYLYMPSPRLAVVSTALMKFSSNITSDWNILSAAILVVIIPTVAMYLFLQKYIFSGIVNGAVKG